MRLKRRRFLGFGAGAVAGVAFGARSGSEVVDMLSAADNPLYPPDGPESFALSVCAMCPGGCGMLARRIGHRVVKLDGNPLHPVNGGRLCARGQAALQGLYHPDRLPGPLRRVGPRGSLDSFQRVSWDEALEGVAQRLRTLRLRRSPEGLALLRRRHGGVAQRVASRFVRAFGSPHDAAMGRGDEAAAMALEITQGIRSVPAYDVQSAGYVLSLGSAMLEASSSPVHGTLAYGEFRQGRAGRRGKLVHVDSRLSLTGSAADEWIAVRPGTEGVFALGVAAALVAEGLYDKAFVIEHTVGFETGEGGGLRGLLEHEYGLERVARETGVPDHLVLRIAREFAAARPGLAIGPRRGPLLPGMLFAHLAAHTLNALAGNIDAPGGVLVPEPAPLRPHPPLAEETAGSSIDAEGLAERIMADAEPRIEALLLLGTDPILTSATPGRFADAVSHVPLVVSFASLPDDSALHADWILPDAHFLERWDLHGTPPGVAYPVVSLAQPALPDPLHDVRPAAGVFMELARRVDGDLAATFPWADVPELLRWELAGVYEARRGALLGTGFAEAWVRMMERAGWWDPGYRSADELWEGARRTGGWWDPFYDHGDWGRVLETRSRRFEMPVGRLAELAQPAAAAVAGDAVPPSVSGAAGASLALLLFEPLPIAGGTGAELPFLLQLLDPGHEIGWQTWAELHPDTALALGVRSADQVRLVSAQGAIEARAVVTSRVVPGAVAVPVGLGRARGGGRWAAGLGANPLRILAGHRDPGSALPDFAATTVHVMRAEKPREA